MLFCFLTISSACNYFDDEEPTSPADFFYYLFRRKIDKTIIAEKEKYNDVFVSFCLNMNQKKI